MLTASPLDETHLNRLNEGLAAAKVAQEQINLARAAGIDVSQHDAALQAAVKQIQQIKQVYFPGR